MAHAAKLSQLAGDLVTGTTGKTNADPIFKRLHDRALKGLRNTSYPRTNQFDVQSKLSGLTEKFSVLNRDDLSEGLRGRLDALPSDSKWLPEILSLLLELSDRPLEKTRIEVVEAASKSEDEQPVLTWQDIIADDPLDETGIWDDVERGYHSSDGDFTGDEDASGDETGVTSVTEDDLEVMARGLVVPVNGEALDGIEQFRVDVEGRSSKKPPSELMVIRDTLSMLHGLPTEIFCMDAATGEVTIRPNVTLETASESVSEHILVQVAEIGGTLNALRLWAKSMQTAYVVRTCQSTITEELRELSSQIAHLEQRYIDPQSGGLVASVIDVRADIERITRPFVKLTDLIRVSESDSSNLVIALLDRLYQQSCISQLSGDHITFGTSIKVLTAALQTYLRPSATWILAGECSVNIDFFVVQVDADCELGRLWRDRYALRQETGGQPAAPEFLHPFVDRIFALGKGRAFLRALHTCSEDDIAPIPSLSVDLQVNCDDLLPFSQTLTDTLERWIDDKAKDQSPLIRHAIFREHGLLQLPGIFEQIFFSKNGRRFQNFADTLFWRVDQGARWQDAFLLTELAQSTVGSAVGTEAANIAVKVVDEQDTDFASSMRQLETIQLTHHTTAALQNVTASPSPATYTAAFTLLLQAYRAKYLLRTHVFPLRHLDLNNDTASRLHAAAQAALRLQQRLSTIIDIFYAHITHTTSILSTALRQSLERAEGIDDMARIWAEHERVLSVSLLTAERVTPVRESVVRGVFETAERLMRGFARSIIGEDGEDTDGTDLDIGAMEKELESSTSFIIAGLRGIGRAGGNVALEQLSERLEWAVH